jgi:hypothetical protein
MAGQPTIFTLAAPNGSNLQEHAFLRTVSHLELNRRLNLARHAFKQLSKRYLGCSSAPLKQRSTHPHQLDRFNTTCLRRMLNLSTLDHVSNDELYRLADQQSISSLIRMHRLRWLGHLARQAHPRPPAALRP